MSNSGGGVECSIDIDVASRSRSNRISSFKTPPFPVTLLLDCSCLRVRVGRVPRCPELTARRKVLGERVLQFVAGTGYSARSVSDPSQDVNAGALAGYGSKNEPDPTAEVLVDLLDFCRI